jgi:hypothetical protein
VAVDDAGLEAIRKAAEQVTPGDPSDYFIKVGNIDGTPIGSGGGGGSGTEYTEDAASVANPVGGQLMARRRDSLSSETTTDGDVTALNSTAKGELYVKHVDNVPITAASLPLPTGAATSAKQDTIIGHIDGVDALLTSIDSDTGTLAATDFATEAKQDAEIALLTTIDADTSTLAGAVSGTEMQVDVVTLPSTPTGDNVIGRVKITDGFSVADIRALVNSNGINVAVVDSLGNQVTSFGGDNTQYQEDVAGITNPIGTVPIFLRQDTPTGLVSADGDAVGARGSNFGAQYVTLLDSSGNFVGTRTVQGTAAEGDPISGNPVLMGGENPSGDVKPIQLSADGDQIVHQHSASTILSDAVPNTMHIPINETDAGWLITPTFPYVFNGSDWDRTRGDATDGLLVNLGTNNDVISTPVKSTAPTTSNVSGSATNVTLLASNADRKGATVFNDSTAILYLKLGATASTTSFTVKLFENSYYEVPFDYTGIIDGIWASATGSARVTELE